MQKIIVLLSVMIVATSFSAHKYFSSITKVEVDTSSQLLKIYTSVFIDDFERLLQERYQLQVDDFSRLSTTQKNTIVNYLKAKVAFKANRKPLSLNFLGCQVENQLLYLYYEVPFQEKIQRLDIKNELLMDLYTDQHNTVDVTFDNALKSVHLTIQNKNKTIFF